jgi:hypothetical protein
VKQISSNITKYHQISSNIIKYHQLSYYIKLIVYLILSQDLQMVGFYTPQNNLWTGSLPALSPGGSPGTCSDGRSGVTCAVCPRGTFGSLQGRCAKCVEGNQAFWLTLAETAIGP